MLVRSAHGGDEPDILRIFAAAARTAWPHILSEEAFDVFDRRSEMPWGMDEVFVAVDEGAVVGFAQVRPETCELHLLYTDPAVWGKGAGRRLMDVALARLRGRGCTEAFLWTEERNDRPRGVYKRYGWTLSGRRREREVLGSALAELGYRIELGPVDAHGDRADVA